MVILYTGTPGSGKSYHATERVHAAVNRGLNVIANFVVKVKHQERFFFCPTEKITVEYLLNFCNEQHEPNKESQTLVFIDEASILFNSRDCLKKDRANWLKFFSQHRKLGFDVILITQMDRALDRQIRGVIEYNYVHRKLTNYGLKGFFIRLLTFGKNFVCIHKWYVLNERVGVEYFKIRKRIAASYDTFSMFDENDSVIKPLAKGEEVKQIETAETVESETTETEVQKANLLINDYINHIKQCNDTAI